MGDETIEKFSDFLRMVFQKMHDGQTTGISFAVDWNGKKVDFDLFLVAVDGQSVFGDETGGSNGVVH